MSLLVASKIFAKIFGQDIISQIKTSEDIKNLCNRLFEVVHFGPQFEELLFIVAAGRYLESENFRKFLNDEICKRGLAARVWINVNDFSNKLAKEFIVKTAGIDVVSLCTKVIDALIKKEITLRDAISSIFLKIFSADYFIFKQLIRNHSVPSMKAITQISKAPGDVESMFEKISEICENWRIPPALFGLANLTSKEDILHFIRDHLEKIKQSKVSSINDILNFPNFLLFLAVISLPDKPQGQISFEFFHELFSLIMNKKCNASVLSYVIDSFHNFTDEKVGAFIALAFAHRYYGAELYAKAVENITTDGKVYPVSIDIIIDSLTDRSKLRLTTISLQNVEVMKLLNSALSKLGKAPCIVLGIPWELTIPKERIPEEISKAVQIYEKNKITPPQLLKKIKNVTSIVEKVPVMAKKSELSALINCWKQIAMAESEISWISNYTHLITGQEIPILSDLKISLEETKEKIFKTLEFLLIKEYGKVLEGKSEYKSTKDVLLVVKNFIKQGYLPILIVIDGLRLDDYISMLRNELLAIGLKPLEETVIFALIPSITIYSRHAIFYGRQPEFFAYTSKGVYLKREDELFENAIGNTVFLCGSTQEIITKVRSMNLQQISKLQAVAVVLSELEKAVHGSPEAILAHMPESFAREIALLIRDIIEFFIKHKKKIAVIITSDHGLAEFFETTSVNVKVFKHLRRKRALDPVFSVVETPRFAIFPFISEVEMNASLHEIEQMCQGEAYAIPARRLGINRIALMVRKTNVPSVIDASRILFLFPKGRKKFETKIRQIVLHGGIHPIEVLVPLACWVPSVS